VQAEIAAGNIHVFARFEDIHMNVEARLRNWSARQPGASTPRARATIGRADFSVYVRDNPRPSRRAAWRASAPCRQGGAHASTIMPGFTHLQVAAATTFGHQPSAYVEMLARDRGRFADARKRTNESRRPQHSPAHRFPIDRDMTARELGFDRPMRNSLDAVSDVISLSKRWAAAAIAATHLSRLREEIVICASAQFRFVTLSTSSRRLIHHAAEAQSGCGGAVAAPSRAAFSGRSSHSWW